MPPVAGGSAFFVRPKPYARFGVTNKTMKKHIALGLVASTLLLAGCCTTHQVTQWEYKTYREGVDVGVAGDPLGEHLSQLAAQGWIVESVLIYSEGGFSTFLLKRPKQ